MRLFFAAALLIGFHAQSIQDYLKVRKQYGIVQSVGVAALETLYGTRVVEVQGTVKGSLKVGADATILLEKTDGSTMMIDAKNVPDWLNGDEVSARLIIRATRTDFHGPVLATLIAAAPEDEVEPIEAKAIISAARNATPPKSSSSSKAGGPRFYVKQGARRVWILPADKATPYYAAYAKKHNPKLSNAEAMRIGEGVVGFSKKYGVDATLIMAMIVCESDFNPHELSHAGAMGLGQLMPETVQDYGISNPYDTIENLYGTVREIREHIDKYRNQTGDDFQALVLGLAAYNAGEGAVKRHGGIPPYRETQNYVRKVIRLYNQLRGAG